MKPLYSTYISACNSTVIVDKDKVEVLNAHFTRCFNYSVPVLKEVHVITPDVSPSYLLCHEDEVRQMLSSIHASKESGTNGTGLEC